MCMKRLGALFVTASLLAPLPALAFPFGGQASQVINCYNQAIYASLGAPIGGPYIWTPGTKTYQFGPPSRAGQWILGLASAPYYCIVSIIPLTIYSGTAISMMGSSGPSAPAYNPADNNITPGGGSFGGGGASDSWGTSSSTSSK